MSKDEFMSLPDEMFPPTGDDFDCTVPFHAKEGDESEDTTNKMSITEFREKGYLQELNRRFLHPLGLALEVVVEDDGSERFGGVWDYRDDPEGIIYGEDTLDPQKVENINNEYNSRRGAREEALGYMVQPVEINPNVRDS